ncbi:MAG: hypothetical protein KAS62_04120, partial [Candidatus Delongbacteria bacterium]|nr:hypothetical protein [Candidatus Delongbacteria bacterium]
EKGYGKVNEFNIVLFNLIRVENEGSSLKFEDTLSFAYSLLEYFSKNWFTVNFYYFVNRELKFLTVTNDKGNYPKLYEIICRMDYYVDPEIKNTANQLRKKLKRHSNSFFILPSEDNEVINFANNFRSITAVNDDNINKKRVIHIPKVNKNIEQITIL